MLRFAYLLLFCTLSREAFASASCKQSGTMHVIKKSVQQKGHHYEKSEINRTAPVELIYNVFTYDRKVESISWKLNDKSIHVDDDTNSDLHYVVTEEQLNLRVTLSIRVPSVRLTGEWSMTMVTSDGKEHRAICTIEVPPILRPFEGAIRVNEGDPLSVRCQLDSIPRSVTVEWKRYVDVDGTLQLVPVPDANFKPENNVKNSIIEWQNTTGVGGFYLCTATASSGSDNVLVEIRIKNMGTYLWPSIGILLEFVVLIITIAIYERSQSKKRKAEADRSLNQGEK